MGIVENLMAGRLPRLGPPSSRAMPVVICAGALTLCVLAMHVTNQTERVATDGGWLDPWAAVDRAPTLIRAHTALSALFVLLAAPLFWPRLRNRHWKTHRALGRVALACMIVLPITGIADAIVYPSGAVAGVLPNLAWLAAVLGCVAMAGRCVGEKDILGHEAWVTRATAMTAGITLFAICDPILVNGFGMDPRQSATLVVWLGLGEGLATAETSLRKSRGTLARRRALLAAARR